MIDPAFSFISRLIVPAFKAAGDPIRDYFDKYYIPINC